MEYDEGILFVKPDDEWGEYVKGDPEKWLNERYNNRSVKLCQRTNRVFVDYENVGVLEKFTGWRSRNKFVD